MAQALGTNTTIGGFELGSVIGRGGFGITYRAKEMATGNTYAIKEYLPEDLSARLPGGTVQPTEGAEEDFHRGLDAFLQEANTLKNLPHRKGLVRVRGAFEKYDTAYCVMEFIEGDSLDQIAKRTVERHNHVPENLVEELTIAVCWALDALHRESLIHRDVKPGNVMLRRSGEPVLIDFGAARKLSREREARVILTRRYAPVEQYPVEMNRFGRQFDEGPWTDLYALSIVLYELITQNTPPDALARAAAILAGRPDPLSPLTGSQHADRYSTSLLKAVDKGCTLLPSGRHRSAQELAEAIRPGMWVSLERSGRSKPEVGATRQADAAKTKQHENRAWPGQGAPKTGRVDHRRRRRGLGWVLLLILAAAMSAGAWIYTTYFQVEVF